MQVERDYYAVFHSIEGTFITAVKFAQVAVAADSPLREKADTFAALSRALIVSRLSLLCPAAMGTTPNALKNGLRYQVS